MIDSSHIDGLTNRLADIRRQMKELSNEADDLEVALRVLQKYAPKTQSTPLGSRLGPPRPEGTPTLFEMTEEVIREAMSIGLPGLKGREIVKHIGTKYWPGVKPEQIMPSVYTFARQGRLNKRKDGLFTIKAADHESVGDESTALFPNHSGPVKPVPEGGT